jgi:hypothetical protein
MKQYFIGSKLILNANKTNFIKVVISIRSYYYTNKVWSIHRRTKNNKAPTLQTDNHLTFIIQEMGI